MSAADGTSGEVGLCSGLNGRTGEEGHGGTTGEVGWGGTTGEAGRVGDGSLNFLRLW